MPKSTSLNDIPISVMDQFAKEFLGNWWNSKGYEKLDREKISRTYPPTKEYEDMNITEKTLVKSFMGIEHGPGASEDDLILASGYFHAVEREIKLQGNKVPPKFQEAINAVDRDLGIKQMDSKQKKLQELRDERDSLLSKEEKRKVVEAEIARLEEELKK